MIKEHFKYRKCNDRYLDGYYRYGMYKMGFTEHVNILIIQSKLYMSSFMGNKHLPNTKKITSEDTNNDAESTF